MGRGLSHWARLPGAERRRRRPHRRARRQGRSV